VGAGGAARQRAQERAGKVGSRAHGAR
jgi:hypothetical protein